MFVSDPPNRRVLWYQLHRRRDGLLETAQRRAAVEGYNASWLAVNSLGDLYFTGRQAGENVVSNVDSVFRQDVADIVAGNSMMPTEVYSRANSGNPNARVWVPSGVSVDSFNIYWGNQEGGTTHGSVVRGPRQNLGSVVSSAAAIMELSTQMEEVRGVTQTGTHVFWLAPQGVYGLTKTASSTVISPDEGLIAQPPPGGDDNLPSWNPMAIAYDGDSSVYITDASAAGRGMLYTLPALNLAQHNLTRFVEAPGIYHLAILDFQTVYAPDVGAASTVRASYFALGLSAFLATALIPEVAAAA
jgi:hypothetical protein